MTPMEEDKSANTDRIMSRDEVRAVDRWAIDEMGVPGVALMENAGRSCAERVLELLEGVEAPRVCIFCGTGNNGGDGYVIARHLLNRGVAVCVVVCGRLEKIAGDARVNLEVLQRFGHPIERIEPGEPDFPGRVRTLAGQADVIVDALFGTGLQGPLRGDYQTLIEAINGLQIPTLAVDIPSGLDCDTGQPLGVAIRAVCTVTFVAIKQGFRASPQSSDYTGRVYVASIGIEPPASSGD